MLAAAKNSEALAAESLPAGPTTALKIMTIKPLHLLRFTAFQCGHVEHQLPEQKPLECVYLGQPKGDDSFAHASLDWTAPESGPRWTKVSFEWRVQRGDQSIVARTDPPLNYDTVERSTLIELPEHFRMSKKLLDVFGGVCQRSLARLGKYRPPCTIVACKLLGSPKRAPVEPGDVHTLRCEDGSCAAQANVHGKLPAREGSASHVSS